MPEAPATNDANRTERERGKLTFRGSYGYKQPNDPTGVGRGLVTIAGTMDCATGKGTFYYRDAVQRIEWQSSRFSFDPNAVCFTDPENLQALVNTFSAQVTGAYSPLRLDASMASGDGNFAIRLAGTDPGGAVLSSAIFCLALQGGAYGHYTLPRNARNSAGTDEGCTYLDNFTIQRSK